MKLALHHAARSSTQKQLGGAHTHSLPFRREAAQMIRRRTYGNGKKFMPCHVMWYSVRLVRGWPSDPAATTYRVQIDMIGNLISWMGFMVIMAGGAVGVVGVVGVSAPRPLLCCAPYQYSPPREKKLGVATAKAKAMAKRTSTIRGLGSGDYHLGTYDYYYYYYRKYSILC